MGNERSSKVDEWLTEDKLELLTCWARDFTLTEVAEKVGVAPSTLLSWRDKFPEIRKAIQDGKEVVDYRVENALLKVALGYTCTETKTYISAPDKFGNRRVRYEKQEKEVPPNPTAIMCWLNNRKPDQWKRNRDNILRTEDKDNNIVVNIIHKGNSTVIDDKDEEGWSATVNNNNASNKRNAKNEGFGGSEDLDYWPDDYEEN